MKVCIGGFHVSGCVAMLPAAPILPRKHVRRVSGGLSSLDLGRGSPYQCSFCTIINVQGRKSRFRSPTILSARSAKTIGGATGGSSSPTTISELFDRMIQLRVVEELKIGFTTQCWI